ncbi:hypothetical protein GCM10010260_39010 [Streptomyces filipinensis]|uniref:Uncharacterized protein n=1 Tax=Streptomyces filipinensis TaxID=66887 RepID=A0A918IBX1_9ACTN|nr:hypothetical protein [Streptomyces filipinensis]GGU99025.1 hypothetical protein GCM10010260_39010 [Streptomyces filipinensis]
MGEITAASADPPAGPSAAVAHWNAFAKAVADVLESEPSASRTTVLHALHACHRELKTVDPLHPYEEDAAETITRVMEATLALGFAIRAGQAAAGTVTGEPVTTEASAGALAEPGHDTGSGADPVARFAERLSELCAELGDEHTRHLSGWRHARPKGRPQAADHQQAAAVWTALHMALLRLPDADRRIWQEKAAQAAQEYVGGPPPGWEDPDVIVPALPAPQGPAAPDGCGGIPQAVTVPLDLSDAESLRQAAAAAPPEVLEAVDVAGVDSLGPDDLRLSWAARAGQILRLAGLDPELHAISYPLNYPCTSRLPLVEGKNQKNFRTRLLTQLASAAQAHHSKRDGKTQLGAARQLDGVLGGLLHWPTAAPGSWWWRWRKEVSLILEPLARAVDHEVVYDQTSEWQKTDLDNCTETGLNLGGAGEPDERLVQWVFFTPLCRTGVAEPRTDFRGRVVRRPDPADT